jgi:hypothetical protein
MPKFQNVKTSSFFLRSVAGASFASLLLAFSGGPRAQTIPTDPVQTTGCTISQSDFNTWFASGTPTLNGVVNPANSVGFPGIPNCTFYFWAKQMFLWLTSPAPSIYGGGGIILDSPTFYDVSPPDSTGNRTLLAHTSGFIRPFSVRAAQVGGLGLPVIFDTSGRMLQVVGANTVVSATIRVLNNEGHLVEITHAERASNGRVILRDEKGSVIEPKRALRTPAPAAQSVTPLLVQKFIVDGIPIFIDPFGNVVEVEQGQSTGGVLMAQNKSLIYYAILVNDVYAYFLTGVKDGQIETGNPTPQFPVSMGDLNAITTFGAGHGASFLDGQALAVEIKTSWIEASSLSNPSNYIRIQATVPTYDTSNPALWTPTGTKTTTLAMVGMHVVGSTAGHPEMIWATFEHFGNTPNAAYSYVNSSNVVTPVGQTTAGTWLFSATNATAPFNNQNMSLSGANIQANTGPGNAGSTLPGTISPSNTIRWKAFGAATDLPPNPIDANAAASNSEIILVHNNIAGMMPSGDVRNNYIMTGATWTIPGANGLGQTPLPIFGNSTPAACVPTQQNPLPCNQVGTSQLSNSTMETYQQGNDTTSTNGSNCFSCHSSPGPAGAPIVIGNDMLSHVFGAIKPLF